MTAGQRLRVLNPAGVVVQPAGSETTRDVVPIPNLEHATVGLIDNGKWQVPELFDILKQKMAADFRVKTFVYVPKPSQSRPAEPEALDRLARECDFVIAGLGD